MRFEIGDLQEHKKAIEAMILEKKSQGSFTVIDVGGDAAKFNEGVYDAIADINAENSDVNFKMDICEEWQWEILINRTKQYGKFDYCICSHTLEDVYNPYTALRYFPLIAKAGAILVPNYTTELSHVEDAQYFGYIHHRYLFKEKDGKLLVAPKMPLVERLIPDHNETKLVNLTIHWEDKIDYTVFMDNYLGPNVQTVANKFLLEFRD